MAAKILNAKLVERIKRTPSIESFRFISEGSIEFAPGQFLQLIFEENDLNNKELNKYLSFSSSPTKEYIEVTKRLSQSHFSQRLRSLSMGDQVMLKAPLGSCIFKDDYPKIAFLIGGIGITPVISIIEYIFDRKLTTDVVLIYSNRTEEEIAFRQRLDYWLTNNRQIKVVYTLTDCKPKNDSCVSGRIDKNMLIGNIADFDKRVVFIYGHPKMVEAMKKLSLEQGAKESDLKTESFLGY